ncbi:transcriptional regulator, partial [Mesorhizobium sp. M7A.F.Ca.US.003.02.2.1]
VELIGENQASERGGRGVRLKSAVPPDPKAEPA